MMTVLNWAMLAIVWTLTLYSVVSLTAHLLWVILGGPWRKE